MTSGVNAALLKWCVCSNSFATLDAGAGIHQSLVMYRIIGADGREYGPISAEQLRQWIAEGRAIATTRVLREGASDWTTLGALPEFSLLFGGATSQRGAVPGAPVTVTSRSRNNGFAVAGFVVGIFSVTVG